MDRLSRRSFLSLATAAWALLSPWPGAAQRPGMKRTPLAIVTESGRHKFTVELAVSDKEQERGLMFRRRMAADAGMLFDYKRPQIITMWMRNTLIPLDMIFIGADGKIINIAQRTVPGSLDSIPSRTPALAVLEVNGGTSSRLKIKPGDRVLHPIFGNAGK